MKNEILDFLKIFPDGTIKEYMEYLSNPGPAERAIKEKLLSAKDIEYRQRMIIQEQAQTDFERLREKYKKVAKSLDL